MTAPPTTRPRRVSRLLGATAACLALAMSSACTAGQGSAARTSSSPAPNGSSTSSPPASTAKTSTTTTTTPAPTTTPTTTTTAAPSCAEQIAASLSTAQKVGQLMMVGLQPTGSSRALAAQVGSQHLGGVIYLGGWQGAGTVSTVSKRLQGAATQKTTGGVGLLVAADQEGGQVQQLEGAGFSTVPSARTQATFGATALRRAAAVWAGELRSTGVNVNLAPVADTVPASLGAGNDPIGRHRRDFNPGDPAANGRDVVAFVRGTLDADVAPTVKHFPGLGRISGNTDLTSWGTTDEVADVDDPYLEPFAEGIRAGAPLVMVGSARYPKLDARNQAMFSKAIVTDLLRRRLGFDGVVITDDVGAAKAVSAVPVGERATRFVAAGGDIVLTADAGQAKTMIGAITARLKSSRTFAAQVDRAATRVVELKVRLGLASC